MMPRKLWEEGQAAATFGGARIVNELFAPGMGRGGLYAAASRMPAGFDDVPTGAEITRRHTAEGDTGRTVTTARWVAGGPPKTASGGGGGLPQDMFAPRIGDVIAGLGATEAPPAARMPREALPRTGSARDDQLLSDLRFSRDTGRRRIARELLESFRGERGRVDKLRTDYANRQTAERIAAAGAAGQAAAGGAKTLDDLMSAFTKGLDWSNTQEDNARAEALMNIQKEQQDWARQTRQQGLDWEQSIRDRAAEDIAEGQKAGLPFETKQDPATLKWFFRNRGDIDPKTGAWNWKPISQSLAEQLAGLMAPGAGGPDGGKAGGQEEAAGAGAASQTVYGSEAEARAAGVKPGQMYQGRDASGKIHRFRMG